MEVVVQLQSDNYEDLKEAVAEEAIEFGIEQSQIPGLVTWAKAQHNPNYLVFTDVHPPLQFVQRFISPDSLVHVIGIGLHASLLSSFESQLAKDMNRGFGLAEIVNEKCPLAAGGTAIGYEPLGFEACHFHSWLCHDVPDETFRQFGIAPNRFGLIDNLQDARRANDYLLKAGAEPAIWEPWLLLDYSEGINRGRMG